jgi:hypothetical protein
MFKIAPSVLASLRAGNSSALTSDDAKEVARYIDTLAELEGVPELLQATFDEVRTLHGAIDSSVMRNAREARLRLRDQRRAR